VSGGGEVINSPDIDAQVDKLVESIELLGCRILGRKCVRDHIRDDRNNILVAMTDDYIQHTLWFEILKVGKSCRQITQDRLETSRVFMYFPEWDDGLHAIGNELFVVDESMMEGKSPSLKPFIVEEPK
jgi:hypothetical protein